MNRFILLLVCIVIFASIGNVSAQYSTNPDFVERRNLLVSDLHSQQWDAVMFWNLVTLHICAADYTPGITATPNQSGPTAVSRAFAIIHGAMYDAMAIFNPSYKLIKYPASRLFFVIRSDSSPTSAAVMEAAYQTLKALYPSHSDLIDMTREFYREILDGNQLFQISTEVGVSWGKKVASYFLQQRQNDGSQTMKTYTPNPSPGYHQEDPTRPGQGFLGVNWGQVTPFLLDSSSQYRPSNIVGETLESRQTFLNSSMYVTEFNEVKEIGKNLSTTRTPDQTEIGIFWAYDSAPKIGVPPRLYNQVVRVIAFQEKNTLQNNARLFALINYALGDAAIACWEAKYYYQLWRPIVGIRTGTNSTEADPGWTPLGAPSDGKGENFTPEFPSYVSGHATFGSSCFETLRLFYKSDNISFAVQSDEYNGRTIDSNTGVARPAKTRKYSSFTQAENENYESRIYLGVHWRIDQAEGRTLGRKVAQHIFQKF